MKKPEIYSLKFTVTGLPKMTNPSGAKSTHWRVVKRERDMWIRLVINAVRFKEPPKPLKTATLILTRYSSRRPDYDGLVSGFKSTIDALVKSGILENDKHENIGIPLYGWIKTSPKSGHIEVTLREGLKEGKNGV